MEGKNVGDWALQNVLICCSKCWSKTMQQRFPDCCIRMYSLWPIMKGLLCVYGAQRTRTHTRTDQATWLSSLKIIRHHYEFPCFLLPPLVHFIHVLELWEWLMQLTCSHHEFSLRYYICTLPEPRLRGWHQHTRARTYTHKIGWCCDNCSSVIGWAQSVIKGTTRQLLSQMMNMIIVFFGWRTGLQ